jgi:hypothetical protein
VIMISHKHSAASQAMTAPLNLRKCTNRVIYVAATVVASAPTAGKEGVSFRGLHGLEKLTEANDSQHDDDDDKPGLAGEDLDSPCVE